MGQTSLLLIDQFVIVDLQTSSLCIDEFEKIAALLSENLQEELLRLSFFEVNNFQGVKPLSIVLQIFLD